VFACRLSCILVWIILREAHFIRSAWLLLVVPCLSTLLSSSIWESRTRKDKAGRLGGYIPWVTEKNIAVEKGNGEESVVKQMSHITL
jgi:hypothetical protein